MLKKFFESDKNLGRSDIAEGRKKDGLIKRIKIVGKKSLFKTGYPKNNGEIRLKKCHEFHFLRLKEILKLSCSP